MSSKRNATPEVSTKSSLDARFLRHAADSRPAPDFLGTRLANGSGMLAACHVCLHASMLGLFMVSFSSALPVPVSLLSLPPAFSAFVGCAAVLDLTTAFLLKICLQAAGKFSVCKIE